MCMMSNLFINYVYVEKCRLLVYCHKTLQKVFVVTLYFDIYSTQT